MSVLQAYTPLITQQKRLRHLKSIAGRNIQYNSQNSRDISTINIFFTLHSSKVAREFYTSEKLQTSMNPSWKGFNLDHIPLKDLNTTKSSFVVKIWSGKDADYSPCIVWDVDLTGLVYIGDKLQKEVIFPPNTLLFGMLNGYYTAPAQNSEYVDRNLVDNLTVDQSVCRQSYSVSTLSRVQTVLRAIKQTEVSGGNVRTKIEKKISQAKEIQQKKSELEDLKIRIRQIQCDLEWRTIKLQTEKEHYETDQTRNIQRDMSQRKRYDTLKNDRARLHERKKKYFDVREDLIKNGAQLVMRRKQLISELAFIYPIRELPNHAYTISEVSLPNATEFQGANEVMLEVALGYTCHLVHMISHFLDMPLRYPMDHKGSKSLIIDHIMDKLGEKDREFPIYSKGKEKFQFDYGVYLLNKNIAQLRYYCGLGTTDLRITLPNLKTLLQLRLGVKFDHYESYDHTKDTLQQRYSSVQTNNLEAQLISKEERTSKKEQNNSSHSTASQQRHPCIYEQGVNGTNDLNSPVKTETSGINTGSDSSVINGKANKDTESHSDNYSDRTNSSSHPIPDDDLFTRPAEDDFFTPMKQNDDGFVHKDLRLNINTHSTECEAFQTPLCDSSQSNTIKTLDELMKEKLLGPITNYQDIDVSSSEDSSNAVYGSKLWPRMLDNITLQNDHIAGPHDHKPETFTHRESVQSELPLKQSVVLQKTRALSSDTSDNDVDEVPTFKTSAMHTERNNGKNIGEQHCSDGNLTEDEECDDKLTRNISIVEAGEDLQLSESESPFKDFSPTFKLNK